MPRTFEKERHLDLLRIHFPLSVGLWLLEPKERDRGDGEEQMVTLALELGRHEIGLVNPYADARTSTRGEEKGDLVPKRHVVGL
jgi:hypothetical protein